MTGRPKKGGKVTPEVLPLHTYSVLRDVPKDVSLSYIQIYGQCDPMRANMNSSDRSIGSATVIMVRRAEEHFEDTRSLGRDALIIDLSGTKHEGVHIQEAFYEHYGWLRSIF
jgi:hypothetical protein